MTEAEARKEAERILSDLDLSKGCENDPYFDCDCELAKNIAAALLKAANDAKEDAARTATEMFLETRTIIGARETVWVYSGSVQDAIRGMYENRTGGEGG